VSNPGNQTGTTATAASLPITATDGTGATGAATFTWTVSGPAGACTVSYSTVSQWSGGFVASVTISNGGTSAINGWTRAFTFPGGQKITNSWNGVVTQSGQSVSIGNESYNASIPAGSSTQLGFQGTWTSSDAAPTGFTLNGTACSL
jgi:Cellulose binding domain